MIDGLIIIALLCILSYLAGYCMNYDDPKKYRFFEELHTDKEGGVTAYGTFKGGILPKIGTQFWIHAYKKPIEMVLTEIRLNSKAEYTWRGQDFQSFYQDRRIHD